MRKLRRKWQKLRNRKEKKKRKETKRRNEEKKVTKKRSKEEKKRKEIKEKKKSNPTTPPPRVYTRVRVRVYVINPHLWQTQKKRKEKVPRKRKEKAHKDFLMSSTTKNLFLSVADRLPSGLCRYW